MVQVGAGLDKRATRLGHLGAIHHQKPMSINSGRHSHAGAHQHCRPKQGVEVDDVLANKMINLSI